MVTEAWIRKLIERDELWRFYKTGEWRRLKEAVLREAHHECAECKRLGKITRYDVGEDGQKRILSTVHHVMHVRDHPELALSRQYPGGDGRMHANLLPVCKACHNKLHPEKRRNGKKPEGFMNEERW